MGRISGEPDQNGKPSLVLFDSGSSASFAWEGEQELGAAFVQIVDNSGTPIVSFGGDTQYTNGSAQPTPLGTVALGYDGSNVRAIKTAADGTLAMPTVAVTGTFWQATQPVSIASMPSTPVTGTFFQATQPVSEADGANVTLGAKADAKNTATDTTSVSIMSVLKQISASVQAPPSQAVTNAGTFAAQATLQTQTDTVMVGGVNIKEINAATPLMGNGTTGTGSQRVTTASDNSAVALWGHGATAASVPANAQYKGVRGATALPTAVSDGQLVGAAADKYGRQVALLGTIRDLVGTQTTTISASTAETTIVTAAASVFNDLTLLVVSNTSASTNTRIDFRDTTGGTVLFSLQSIGGANPVGFSLGGAIIPQTSVNTNWTAQCATSTTDVRVYAVYAKNK